MPIKSALNSAKAHSIIQWKYKTFGYNILNQSNRTMKNYDCF